MSYFIPMTKRQYNSAAELNVALSELIQVYSKPAEEDHAAYVPTGHDFDVRKVVTAKRTKRISFTEAKKSVPKVEGESRDAWLARVESARVLTEEYSEYVPLTIGEKLALFA